MSDFRTPILFLVFNRPAETARVFQAIRQRRPRFLYIAADGPRLDRAGEAALVSECREIVSAVDWPCEVRTLFRDTNQGCGRAVSGAISWFFEQVEEGIVLEDDCLPHPDFFPYCETLLGRYRDEARVATISGTHFLPHQFPHEKSHYVSKYFQMWGWATWRRTWQHYIFDVDQIGSEGFERMLEARHPIAVERRYWAEIAAALRAGHIDTWDFQVFFSAWKTGANHVMPGRNLVANIGFGASATHTNFSSPMANLPTFPLQVTNDAISLEPDPSVDNLVFYLRFLESMTHTYWLERILPGRVQTEGNCGELARQARRIRQLELELSEKRQQLLSAAKALAQKVSFAT